jgi:hypothetical protein
MYIHILDLYFRQACLSPKQNFGTIENRDLKPVCAIIDSKISWKNQSSSEWNIVVERLVLGL